MDIKIFLKINFKKCGGLDLVMWFENVMLGLSFINSFQIDYTKVHRLCSSYFHSPTFNFNMVFTFLHLCVISRFCFYWFL